MMETYEIEVYGHVHGVGYRWYARKIAIELGITGWVKNSYDGSVKIQAQGDDLMIRTFTDYLKIGPPMARVTDVTVYKRTEFEVFNDFTIQY